MTRIPSWLAVLPLLAFTAATSGQSFVNWENPHVHPLDITPDGRALLAVNTPDNRLEVFDITGGTPRHVGSVPVGLDPVSVRARTDTEVWVVNHISDSVSIVALGAMNVVASLRTADEPADVVFAGSPQAAFVSCSQANLIQVFDADDPALAPISIPIEGEGPRAMAVGIGANAGMDEVYVAIFHSGNRSTILGGGSTLAGGFPPNVVSDPLGPYGGMNPPPNDGANFRPAQRPGNPPPPRVSLIAKKAADGRWMDDNGSDWTNLVSGFQAPRSGRRTGWDLYDHDLAVIKTGSLAVSYATDAMNLCMALAVNPATGRVTVVGTDATNEVRFEPVLAGRFLRVELAAIAPSTLATTAVVDLNSHLTYTDEIPFVPIAQTERDKSLGDPRAIVWRASGDRGYVAGMGSNNLLVIDGEGNRIAPIGKTERLPIEMGEGPTGLALSESRGRLYVLNKFSATISVLDLANETVIETVGFFDAAPAAIRIGRKHLYDTHRNSGFGHIACASCHPDGRMDRLAWDLGNPAGTVKAFNQNCLTGGCLPWHPMKGPMATQTLQDIIGREPHHWRGDRNGLEEFAGTFQGLQGDDGPLPPAEMQELENFLATIHFPPNPFRNFDNTLPSDLPLPGHFTSGRFGPAGQPLPNGNAVTGLNRFRTALLDGVNCVRCHTLPSGMAEDAGPSGSNGERHLALVAMGASTNVSMKVPHLRNQSDKVGFELTQLRNTAGFGFLHDGSLDSIARFVNEPLFSLTSNQDTANMVAFMLAFAGSELPAGSSGDPQEPPGPTGQDTHAAVGWQTTLIDASNPAPGQLALISNMLSLADATKVGVVVKGVQSGAARGYTYIGGGQFQSDRQAETVSAAALQSAAVPGSELTYTLVPRGSETRIGIDRDSDGSFDRDEIDACGDPLELEPGPCGCGVAATDTDVDGVADCIDLCPNDTVVKKSNPGICGCGVADTDSDGDGVPNCNDQCPNSRDLDSDSDGLLNCDELCPFDPAKFEPGGCGCGRPEIDGDDDGTPDCRDLCPEDRDKSSPGVCGCGVPDDDADADGVADCNDRSPAGLPEALVLEGPDEIMAGQSAHFIARLRYTDGTTEDVSDQVAWRVLDTVLPSADSGLFTGDTLTEDGNLTVSSDRETKTTFAVMASFTEGTRKYDGARMVRIMIAREQAGEFVPVDGGAGAEPSAGQGVGSANGSRSGSLCGIGFLAPAVTAFTVLGLLRRSRRR